MITCIAIDDEPLALKQISTYIGKTPFLELKKEFESGLQAMSWLQNNTIDLMFVDINMPDLSGLDFVKSLQNPPKIIFTTAYDQYALEGFKVNAIDYLLKPIDYTAFLKSANKAKVWFNTTQKNSNITSNNDSLFIKSEYKIIRLYFKEILYIESMREYVKIYLSQQKPIMTLLSMKLLESKLPLNYFMRVHRSYIVNLSKITTIERNRIVFNKTYIPISEQYKKKFQEYVNTNFLK